MQEDLATLIRNTAARVRARDFMWAVGISAGVGAAVIIAGLADWGPVLLAWGAFMAALAVRYRFSSGRVWAAPVQRVVETELNAQEAELVNLRMVRDVAEALPEPLFILDAEGIVEHANPAAEELVGAKDIAGRHFAAVLRAPAVYEAVERVLESHAPERVEFSTKGSVDRWCRAYVTSIETGADRASMLAGEGVTASRSQRSLVFIRDLTSEHRLEQMRADFIASASHELRTPLASVLGFIETLRGPAKNDPEAQNKFLSIMQSQAERMQRLVSDLMSLSHIELNEHVPPRDIVDIRETAADVAESLAPLFDQAGAIVDFISETDEPTTVRGDRDEIFQAVQNLLHNSVKYGGEPAMIKLRVGRGVAPSLTEGNEPGARAGDAPEQVAARLGVEIGDLVYFQIRDFGPGVDRGALPRLTERFYRVNIERSRKSGGTGLGLAIVKHILNRHKGGFQIESKLARGTAFTCYFQSAP